MDGDQEGGSSKDKGKQRAADDAADDAYNGPEAGTRGARSGSLTAARREASPSPSRSQSPTATATATVRGGASTIKSPTSTHGSGSHSTKQEMSERRRRDHVSVGSRMSRTIVVRPPYAARDELDFERRPRSNTVGTTVESEGSGSKRGGLGGGAQGSSSRHLGIQPAAHAQPGGTGNDQQTRSQLSSSSTTVVNDPKTSPNAKQTPSPAADADNPDRAGKANGQQGAATAAPETVDTGLPQVPPEVHHQAGPDRPSNPTRQVSNDASRWLAFTLPVKYRKRLDDYMAGRAPHPDTRQDDGERSSSSSSRHAGDSDSDEESGAEDWHNSYFGWSKKRNAGRASRNPSRRPSGDNHEGAEADVEGGRRTPENAGTRKKRKDGKSEKRDGGRKKRRNGKRNPDHVEEGSDEADGEEGHQSDADDGEEGLAMTMRARIPEIISTNQGQTPGWNSPWAPHAPARRTQSNDSAAGQGHGVGPHPSRRSGSPGPVGVNRFASLTHGRGSRGDGTSITKRKAKKVKTRAERFQHWLIRSAFAPLAFRLLNLAFSACILAIAIHIRQLSQRNGVNGIMGSSTTFAIVTGPLSLVHIFTNVYAEYFGSPIGVWKVRSKMFYTFTELIFVCLWSGLLSLSFDDLFTSPAGCTSYTPNGSYRNVPIGSAAVNGSIADQLCDNQTALVSMVFVGLILYTLVLIVSLFRIFAKINRYQ